MYKVGQVLFIILNSKQQVIPVQVTEQVVRRTLKGEETTYSVAIPGREGLKSIELNQIDGDVFESIEDVRSQMFEHAKNVISAVTEKALNVARNRFDYAAADGSSAVVNVAPSDEPVSPGLLRTSNGDHSTKLNSRPLKVELPDGTIANVQTPDFSLTTP